jgi:hypothetical protein
MRSFALLTVMLSTAAFATPLALKSGESRKLEFSKLTHVSLLDNGVAEVCVGADGKMHVTALQRGATRLIVDAGGVHAEFEVQVDGMTELPMTWWSASQWRNYSY